MLSNSTKVGQIHLPRVSIRRNGFESRNWTYQDLDLEQRRLSLEIQAGEKGTLLLSEVAPVITVGRRTPPEHISKSISIPVVTTDRGGFATYHGPGQWILFPVEKLSKLTGDPRGVRKAMFALLEVAREVGSFYSAGIEIKWGCETGVWTNRGKFASVGIHIENGVVLHGLSINGFQTKESFQGLKPCGLDSPMDYLLNPELDKNNLQYAFEELGRRILISAVKNFNCAWGTVPSQT